MQTRFRIQWLPCFLLPLILLQSVGNALLFQHLLHQCRRAAVYRLAGRLPASMTTTLRLPPAEQARLRWIDAHEVRYRGRLYDLISREQRQDTLILRALPDHAETQLLARHRRLWQDAPWRHSREGQALQWFQEISQLKYLPVPAIAPALLWEVRSGAAFHLLSATSQSFRAPPDPPPRS